MPQKVTIQDIADALGVSRNTVSKALNNTGVLADATKEKILQKAVEMGYKHFAYMPTLPVQPKAGEIHEIALMTCSMPTGSHFGAHMLNTFQEKISSQGCRLSIYMIRENDIESLSLPNGFNAESTDGIICIEMFDQSYSQLISNLDLPTLFVDTGANPSSYSLDADLLYMENHDSIYQLVCRIIEHGKKNIGFAGDIYHCQSFYERWKGYRDALEDSGIPFSPDNCFTESGKHPYSDTKWLSKKLSALPQLPEVFICANDFIAIDIMKALKALGISVPDDIWLCGFDNSMESRIIEPHLTTVHIPSSAMGYIAADLLLSRIDDPGIPYRTMHVKTVVKYRSSTNITE